MEFLLAAISLGFLGSFHCLGMCGPIALALPIGKQKGIARMGSILVYNLGRAFTYSVFGAVGSQSSGYGWANYWEQGLLEAGVYMPLSFQKYLQLQKKGPVQLTD